MERTHLSDVILCHSDSQGGKASGLEGGDNKVWVCRRTKQSNSLFRVSGGLALGDCWERVGGNFDFLTNWDTRWNLWCHGCSDDCLGYWDLPHDQGHDIYLCYLKEKGILRVLDTFMLLSRSSRTMSKVVLNKSSPSHGRSSISLLSCYKSVKWSQVCLWGR